MDLTQIIQKFTDAGMKIIPLVGSIAFLAFAWGIVRFIKSTGSEAELKKSKSILLWGIIGMFVLISIWGIIAFIRAEFGFGGGTFGIPQIKVN